MVMAPRQAGWRIRQMVFERQTSCPCSGKRPEATRPNNSECTGSDVQRAVISESREFSPTFRSSLAVL